MSDQFGNHPDFILSSQVFLEIKYVHYAANFYHNSLMDEVLTSHKFLDDKALSISWHFLTILLTAILSGAATATVFQWEALQEFWLLMNADWDICSYNCDWSKLDYI